LSASDQPRRRSDEHSSWPEPASEELKLACIPSFKPAYLIHGDDHGRIAERRARLRALAEAESGAEGVELIEGDASTPDAVASALNAMTFAIGRRFVIVDGVQRWKERELEPLELALGAIAPDTTAAFFAREENRLKAPARLHDAVRKAGGDISAVENVKPWELPKWVIARAGELDLRLEPDAARALIGQVGDRQQRLLRELEKLALGAERGAALDAGEIEELAAPSAERKAWTLADALVAGDAQAATRIYVTLRAQGERVPGLLYWMTQRVRAAHEIAEALQRGEPVAQVKRRLRMPSRAADRLIADARRAGAEQLQRALEQLADLELTSRGGGSGATSEDTAALRAIQEIAG
jgi:DNA polymerase III subunit delta